MGDVDDDTVLDLIVGAGENYAPMVAVYSGKALGGKEAFGTQITQFAAFDTSARGGVSVTAAQIDGTTADNIIVGSGPGVPSEVKVFGTELPPLGTAPALFSTFNPYADDRSGVSVASGFVDFATGRYSIITAPGPGVPTQVKVFSFSLMKPLNARPIDIVAKDAGAKKQCPGPKEAQITAAFMPFGLGYTGGASLSTGWLTGSLGGAEAIVVGQLSGPGTVKIYSSGSRLQGGPKSYLLSAAAHSIVPTFTDIAEFKLFDQASGVRVATTSTTVGADLLVSGVSQVDRGVKVRKYQLFRSGADARTLGARQINEVSSGGGSFPGVLGGD
jgi:hypothetical protein